MTNYTITDGEQITLTLKNNTKYGKTTYNNTTYYNNNTEQCIQAKKGGSWNCFSLLTLHQVIIPKNTHYHNNNKASFIFKDIKGLTTTINIPLIFNDFEEDIRKQFNPVFTNNMGYMYGFIKTVLFDIYTDTSVLKKITLYNPETVTLSLAKTDTETLTNAAITITAKDTKNEGIKGLPITGTIGTNEISGTTGNDGTYTYEIESTGTYAVSLATPATEDYKAGTLTDSVTVAEVPAPTEPAEEPTEPSEEPTG